MRLSRSPSKSRAQLICIPKRRRRSTSTASRNWYRTRDITTARCLLRLRRRKFEPTFQRRNRQASGTRKTRKKNCRPFIRIFNGCAANMGKSLLKRRGELVERSFAPCYETGAMRRCTLRGTKNILKRQLVHAGAFNIGISLVLRRMLGAGTPREPKNRTADLMLRLIAYICGLCVPKADSHPFGWHFASDRWILRSSFLLLTTLIMGHCASGA